MSQKVESNKASERVLLARHPERPYSLDLFQSIFENFTELHGDRRYAEDAAMVCGIANLDELEICVIGEQKGRDMAQRRFRNFGMPKPEGYRKALRLMKFAEKFGRPIISFIDTPGAYPGIDAEERGQAEAIAFNLREMASLKVPVIIVVLGEGGSGGALAIGVGDKILMMENAVYSVITPEGCAAILWKDSTQSAKAAECLRLTGEDLLKYKIVDELIGEADGWRISPPISETSEKNSPQNETDIKEVSDYPATIERMKKILKASLLELVKLDSKELVENRFRKFRAMGDWNDSKRA